MTAQGQLREAKLLCLKAVEQYVTRGEPVPVAGLVYVPLGVLFYEMNDLESARHFHKGVAPASNWAWSTTR
jgi:LuxR family maltose regulon positive regulatory protein